VLAIFTYILIFLQKNIVNKNII